MRKGFDMANREETIARINKAFGLGSDFGRPTPRQAGDLVILNEIDLGLVTGRLATHAGEPGAEKPTAAFIDAGIIRPNTAGGYEMVQK